MIWIEILMMSRALYIPGTCLSSILVVEPFKTRSFPIKTRVIWVPGYIYIYKYHHDIYIYIYTVPVTCTVKKLYIPIHWTKQIYKRTRWLCKNPPDITSQSSNKISPTILLQFTIYVHLPSHFGKHVMTLMTQSRDVFIKQKLLWLCFFT